VSSRCAGLTLFLMAVCLIGGPVAAAAGAIPVPPPPGAVASQATLPPFQSWGSPYLHTVVETYRTALAPARLRSYYASRLERLGYRERVVGTSCDASGRCLEDVGFQRGPDVMVLLTIAPSGGGSLYSVALEAIVPPPRPVESVVPDGATTLVVSARADAASPWVEKSFSAPAVVERFRKLVDGLPMDVRGTHGCLVDTGAEAVLRFTARGRRYTFTVQPACLSVQGPGNTALFDPGLRLWNEVRGTLDLAGGHP
jgi:hypothetical protein